MNIYVVTEGITEKKVYREWIKLVNPNLSYAERVEDVINNNYYILSGGGYPSYYDKIKRAIEQINSCEIFDRLVVSVDAEEMSYEEKYREVTSEVPIGDCIVPVKLIIQNYCFESWALGNRAIYKRNPNSTELVQYQRYYNVQNNDPQFLGNYNPKIFSRRAHFALRYLKLMVTEKNMDYSKVAPHCVMHPKYFHQLHTRFIETHHLSSFNDFILAFNENL